MLVSNQTTSPDSHGGSRFVQLVLSVYLFAWTRSPEQLGHPVIAASTEATEERDVAADDGPTGQGCPTVFPMLAGARSHGNAPPSGQGYWLVAADGGIFAYGAAPFHGAQFQRSGAARRPAGYKPVRRLEPDCPRRQRRAVGTTRALATGALCEARPHLVPRRYHEEVRRATRRSAITASPRWRNRSAEQRDGNVAVTIYS